MQLEKSIYFPTHTPELMALAAHPDYLFTGLIELGAVVLLCRNEHKNKHQFIGTRTHCALRKLSNSLGRLVFRTKRGFSAGKRVPRSTLTIITFLDPSA